LVRDIDANRVAPSALFGKLANVDDFDELANVDDFDELANVNDTDKLANVDDMDKLANVDDMDKLDERAGGDVGDVFGRAGGRLQRDMTMIRKNPILYIILFYTFY